MLIGNGLYMGFHPNCIREWVNCRVDTLIIRKGLTLRDDRFLNIHGLTLKDIGYENINLNPVVNYTNEEASDNDIVELNYKHTYESIRGSWVEIIIVMLCLAHGVRCGVRDDIVKIVGYRDDINAAKISIITLQKFIKDRISAHGFNENQKLSYAVCLTDQIIKGIKYPVDPAKSARLAVHMFRKFGLVIIYEKRRTPFLSDNKAIEAAQVDARCFRKKA